jgi:AraC-like DNA-binding protein
MILAGRSDEVNAIFDKIEQNTANLVGIDSLQLFFVLRQLLLRSEQQISPDFSGTDEFLPCILDEGHYEGMERLRSYAIDLSKRSQAYNSKDDTGLYNSIISLIERDFSVPDLSAKYLAEKLKCSLKSIYQAISQNTSLTVSDIIENTRLHFATELLRNTDKTNEEISSLCGFGTMNTFYRVFKKRYAISPGEWRHRETRSDIVS